MIKSKDLWHLKKKSSIVKLKTYLWCLQSVKGFWGVALLSTHPTNNNTHTPNFIVQAILSFRGVSGWFCTFRAFTRWRHSRIFRRFERVACGEGVESGNKIHGCSTGTVSIFDSSMGGAGGGRCVFFNTSKMYLFKFLLLTYVWKMRRGVRPTNHINKK